MPISPIDAIVIAVYLVGITAFGIKVGYRRDASSQQYFLANKSLGWFTVGAAVFTSNIPTLHLVGYAAGGARDGLVIGNFEWMACFILILLALMFALSTSIPVWPRCLSSWRSLLSCSPHVPGCDGILGALLIHIGISLFAAAKVFETLLGVPMFATIVVLSLFTVTYAALGGLKAVVMTESIQVVLLLGGATLTTILGVRALPRVGVHDLAAFQHAVAPGQLHMLQPVMNAQGHLSEFSWLAVVLGYPILGIWYWCADQTHVQRVLGAHTLKDGQNGVLFAGFLKLSPVFLMVFPGVIGYVLWQRGAIHLAYVPGTTRPDYNTMLPLLIQYLIPVGVRGLIAASLAAALMSCMAAALNSCATLISIDVVKRLRPGNGCAGGARRSHHHRGDYGAGHVVVDPGRPVRHHIRSGQQDPHDLCPGGYHRFCARRPVEAGHKASRYGHPLFWLHPRSRLFSRRLARHRQLVSALRSPHRLRRIRDRSRARSRHSVYARGTNHRCGLRGDLCSDQPADAGHGRSRGVKGLLGSPPGLSKRTNDGGE